MRTFKLINEFGFIFGNGQISQNGIVEVTKYLSIDHPEYVEILTEENKYESFNHFIYFNSKDRIIVLMDDTNVLIPCKI